MNPKSLFLIKRGPKPEHHNAPFHPVIICTRKHTATWEVGDTGDGGWLWSRSAQDGGEGWLLERWNGFDIDYGHIVHQITMPDGTRAAFCHVDSEPWQILSQAVWWSDHEIPEWLARFGVTLPEDTFSLADIERDVGMDKLPRKQREKLAEQRGRRETTA